MPFDYIVKEQQEQQQDFKDVEARAAWARV